jgi:phage FluMu protein Com
LLSDALNASYRYLEVKCDGCGTHNTVDLTIIRRPKETPIWQLEQRMRCRPCGHLVRLRGSPVKKDETMCSGLPSLGEIIT